MSAYIVEKAHVVYLVEAAINDTHGSAFRWWTGERPNLESHSLDRCDYERAAEVANMLWCENIKSVSNRYPHESSATLPGTTEKSRVITARDFEGVRWLRFDPVQVIKACHCFDYQSCEHDEWEASEAKAFIEALKASVCHRLPGYDAAQWGPPAKYENAANCIKISDLFPRKLEPKR